MILHYHFLLVEFVSLITYTPYFWMAISYTYKNEAFRWPIAVLAVL